jgi:hypothetical protein
MTYTFFFLSSAARYIAQRHDIALLATLALCEVIGVSVKHTLKGKATCLACLWLRFGFGFPSLDEFASCRILPDFTLWTKPMESHLDMSVASELEVVRV